MKRREVGGINPIFYIERAREVVTSTPLLTRVICRLVKTKEY
jgi:hypothetical protein